MKLTNLQFSEYFKQNVWALRDDIFQPDDDFKSKYYRLLIFILFIIHYYEKYCLHFKVDAVFFLILHTLLNYWNFKTQISHIKI